MIKYIKEKPTLDCKFDYLAFRTDWKIVYPIVTSQCGDCSSMVALGTMNRRGFEQEYLVHVEHIEERIPLW